MGSNEERSLTIEGNEAELKQIEPARSRFPCCVVWTPLPLLSWFFPCIGHIGICRQDGVILDFAGPNFVCVDNFAFGAPTRYLQLSKEQVELELIHMNFGWWYKISPYISELVDFLHPSSLFNASTIQCALDLSGANHISCDATLCVYN